MTSYPWKAMKVSPIALKIAPIPFGRNGRKLPCQSGMPRIAQARAATKNRMIRIFAIVTKFPAFPVSDAPEVDVGEDEARRHRERLFEGEVGKERDVDAEPLEHVTEIGSEPQGVEAARHRVARTTTSNRKGTRSGGGGSFFTHR